MRVYYEAGHTVRECQALFGFGNGTWDSAVARGDVVPRRDQSRRQLNKRRQEVEELLRQGLSQADVARRLGLSKPTVSYHARKLGLPGDPRFSKRYDWSEVQKAHDAGMSAVDCIEHFGFCRATWSQAVARGDLLARPRAAPIETVLVAGRPRSRAHVKRRLFAAGLKELRCERCDLTEWLGEPIGLELHHINGDNDDNRLENLSLLCGNCHAKTPNWGGRGVARRKAA